MAGELLLEESPHLYIDTKEMQANYQTINDGLYNNVAVLPDGVKSLPTGYFKVALQSNLSGHACIWPMAPAGTNNYVPATDSQGKAVGPFFCGDTGAVMQTAAKLFAVHGRSGHRIPVASYIMHSQDAPHGMAGVVMDGTNSPGALSITWTGPDGRPVQPVTISTGSEFGSFLPSISVPSLPDLSGAMPGPVSVSIGLGSAVAVAVLGRSIWRRTAQTRAYWAHRREMKRRQAGASAENSSADAYRLKLLLLLQMIVGPSDDAAEAALRELRTKGNGIDWQPIIPERLPKASQATLLKVLRQLAGTGFIAEARNALAAADKILNDNGATWRGAQL